MEHRALDAPALEIAMRRLGPGSRERGSGIAIQLQSRELFGRAPLGARGHELRQLRPVTGDPPVAAIGYPRKAREDG
jgi:hypothetical protein